MKTSEVYEKLSQAVVSVDQITKKNDIYTIRKSFFHRFGFTASKYVEQVKTVFPNAEIIDSGEIWKPFIGGASISRQSHWFVQFKLPKVI